MEDILSSTISCGVVAGRLEGSSVPHLLWTLHLRRLTGVLHMSRAGVHKKVYYRDGGIIFAASSDPSERLGECLLREGIIRLDHLEEAIRQLHRGKRLGTLLVESGHLKPEDLVRGVLMQVRDIVLNLFAWEDGEYRFDEGPLPTEEVITLGMKTSELLLQGIRKVRSFRRLRSIVGVPRRRYRVAESAGETLDGLDLAEGERLLIERLKLSPASVEELCQDLLVPNLEIYQALWAMKVLGVAEEVERPQLSQDGARLEGRLGPDGIGAILVALDRASETGLLHVAQGNLERTFHIREGRCVFATSNNMDDGLVAYLLRRGVISIRDREETAKRVLTNKRVGSILLQMGVIEEDDLARMVREQLSEIVFDTFRWSDGEYVFVPGELPTIEEIVLDLTTEDLVAESIRRATSWPRIREGCGGLDTPLGLTPGYLEILDRMSVGAAEWEIVSRLGTPRSAAEICRSVEGNDFRTCQVLWTLRLVGAVGNLPAVTQAAEDNDAAASATGFDLVESIVPADAETDVPDDLASPSFDSEPTPADAEPQAVTGSETATTDEAAAPLPPEDERSCGTPADETAAAVEEPIDLPFGAPEAPVPEPQDALSSEDDASETAAIEIADSTEAEPLQEAFAAAEETADADRSPEDAEQERALLADLDEAVSRFNARHRLVYRAIRAEIGAAAANFVRACHNRLGEDVARIFADSRLLPDGTWDTESLKKAAIARRQLDAHAEFEKMIASELDLLRIQIGDTKYEMLRDQIEQA